MRIVHQPGELAPFSRSVCVAIGMFDGVHLGHQQVLRQTITDAQQHGAIPLAITFDRHPSTVVAPERAIPLIHSLAQKLRVLGAHGMKTILLIRFDAAFSAQSGEAFIRGLVRDFRRIHSVCVGSNFTFGHKRSGNVALLKSLGQELEFNVHALAAVSLDGKVTSSTRIRDAIRQGNLDAASQMLGRPYSLTGAVIRGEQLGQQLRFPTANLEVAGLVLPPDGVYAVLTRVGDRTVESVLNIGYRPTVASPVPERRVEAHLLNFEGDLYGQELELTFVEKLREEAQFPSLAALRDQIGRDIAKARVLFGQDR